MNKADILMDQINRLLNGSLNYSDFQEQYYKYFIRKVRNKDLTKEQMDYFSVIQEQFDWTVENPSEEDRRYNYMDWWQFIQFVRQITELFKKDGKLDEVDVQKIRLNILSNSK